MKKRGEEERLLELLEARFCLTEGALSPITDNTELHMPMYKIEIKFIWSSFVEHLLCKIRDQKLVIYKWNRAISICLGVLLS